MSMSEIYDAVQFAADALVMNGESAWDAALAAVEEMGAWDFECWPKPRKPATIASLDEIYKRLYPADLVLGIASRPAHAMRIVTDVNAPMNKAYFVDGAVVLNPQRLAVMQNLNAKA